MPDKPLTVENTDFLDPNQPAPESLSNEAERKLILGKWKSEEEALSSLHKSNQEAARLAEENRQLKELLTNSRVSPAEQAARRSPREALAEYGVPADAIEELVQERIKQAFDPLVRGLQARQKIKESFPDFEKFESEITQFLAENPDLQEEYNATYSSSPVAAMKLAYLEYSRSKKSSPTTTAPPSSVDAVIPSFQTSESRSSTTSDEEEGRRAYEYGKKYGDWGPFAKWRLRGTSIEAHFSK